MALRILLADDSMTAQNMGKKILTDAGYEVVTVSNGAAAVKKIAEITPDLAILDVYMPGYNGLEVCERTKVSPATARIPILLSVGKMEPFRPEDGMKAKADGVIIKPFEATDLLTVVDKLAARCLRKTEAPAAAVAVAAAASAATAAPIEPTQGERAPVASAPAYVEDVPGPAAPAAPALQTFEPADDPISIPEEPHFETTSAAPVGAVDVVAPPEFQTTALRDAGEPDEKHVMTDAALLDGYSFAAPAPEQEPVISDVLSDEDREFLAMAARPDAVPAEDQDPIADVPATPQPLDPVPAEPTAEPATAWHAEEEELTDDDLGLDLEQVMRKAEPEPAQSASGLVEVPGLDITGPAGNSSEPEFDPFVDLSVAPAPAPAPSDRSPVLAPIGKTSFDELDAIMEQAAAQFESVPAGIASAEVSAPAKMTDAPLADDVLDPLQTDCEMGALDPDLMIEEEPAVAEPEPAHLQSSSGLSGVFDLDPPATPAEVHQESTQVPDFSDSLQADQAVAAHGEDMLQQFTDLAGQPDPMEEAGLNLTVQKAAVERSYSEAESVEFAEELIANDEPLAKGVAPAKAADAVAAAQYEAKPVMEQATDLAVAAVNAEIQSVPEHAAGEASVDRVVGRVVDRLRPMLTVMVEEIMKELKK